MSDLNSCSFTGRLVEDAKTKEVNGKTVGQYKIGVNPPRKEADALWVTCDHWNVGGVLEYLTKGTRVAVTGPLKVAKWKGKDGAERQALQLDVRSLVLLGGGQQKKEEEAPSEPKRPAKAAPKKPEWETGADDLPF